MKMIAGFDFGTSSVKLEVVTSEGEVRARAQASYPVVTGGAGQAEQQPEDWWRAAAAALAETGTGERIDAIGLTGQMQDVIAVGHGSALRPALLYSDTRAAVQHGRLREELLAWELITGNQQDVTNVAAKIAWLCDHEPHIVEVSERFLFGAPGYVAWRATGIAVCDVLTASTTGLLNVGGRDWLTEALTAAGARAEQLPRLIGVMPGDNLVGSITTEAAAELGVRSGTPIVHAMGDAGAATDGLVGSQVGDAYLHLGTTGWLAAVTDAPEAPAAPSSIHSLVMPLWESRLRIGAVQSAGAAADWARRSFLQNCSITEAEDRASRRAADPGALRARPLTLPGISGERTPVRDPDFRGAFVGAQEATVGEDFYLSVLTGVALALRHVADQLGVTQRTIPLVGGAAGSKVWRQILADVFNATIVTKQAADPGARSAARAAAEALSLTHTLTPLSVDTNAAAVTEPSPAQPQYDDLIDVHRTLYEALAPSFHALADIRRRAL